MYNRLTTHVDCVRNVRIINEFKKFSLIVSYIFGISQVWRQSKGLQDFWQLLNLYLQKMCTHIDYTGPLTCIYLSIPSDGTLNCLNIYNQLANIYTTCSNCRTLCILPHSVYIFSVLFSQQTATIWVLWHATSDLSIG
jgi:hypothetical protein